MKNQEYQHITHEFEPIYDEKSRVLILGTLPSVKSREGQFYYHHPQNRFWKVLAQITGTEPPKTIAEKKEMLLNNGIAIWDVIQSCDIIGSSDSSIKNVTPADLRIILDKAPVKTIFCNGGKAYELYQKYCSKMTELPVVKLPSTSPANAAWSMERLVEVWKAELNKEETMGHIIDLHCDTIMECMLKEKGLADWNGHINLEKLKKGGSMAQCFALYTISNDMQDEFGYHGELYDIYNRMYEVFSQEMKEHKDVIRQVRSAEDIMKNNAEGKLSAILTIEDCIFLEGKMERVYEMAERGVKMASLTWNYENSIGYPNSKNPELHKLGLKPFGIEAVEAMNNLGIIVDVSHLSEGGFWDVMKYSKKPICASHSCARALCDHSRNLTDEQLKAMGNSGSVVGVNFYSAFLEKDNEKYSSDEAILKHMVYIANKAGIETLALGSDFDGIDCDLEMKDYAGYPRLLEKMQKHFSDDQIDLITHKNFLRIL